MAAKGHILYTVQPVFDHARLEWKEALFSSFALKVRLTLQMTNSDWNEKVLFNLHAFMYNFSFHTSHFLLN